MRDETESVLHKVANSDPQALLANLEQLINAIDHTETEYRALRDLFLGVIEALPNALWVFDESGELYLQNTLANAIPIAHDELREIENDSEMGIDDRYYLFLRNEHGGKVIISATDNTHSKRQERLISMGQMAAHLAHEIRNPIGSVSILASTLFNKVETRSKPLVLEMKKAIWRVERIVKATLLFSKGFTVSPKRFYLDELLDELEMASANYSYGSDIHFEYHFEHVLLEADFDLLSMVLQNMLFNAIDAIEESDEEEGRVEMIHRIDNGMHCIRIHDSGVAFPEGFKLFEAFQSSKVKGNGLGLILSRQIIEAHEGTITVCESPKSFEIRLMCLES